MWLLDENLDVKLIDVLAEFSIKASNTAVQGWRELSNGELTSEAIKAGFTCILTRDGLFGESAAQALKKFPDFSIVIIKLPQRKRTEFFSAFRSAWCKKPINPVKGKLIDWP